MMHLQGAAPSAASQVCCPNALRFLPAEWTVQVQAMTGVDGRSHYFADLYRQGQLMCRIGLSGTFPSREIAEQSLWTRLKDWLSEYETRPHSEDSGFHVL